MEHVHSKDSGQEFPCDICDKVYNNKISLRKHKNWSHSKNRTPIDYQMLKKHVCEYCGAKFSSKSKHSVHVKSIHLNQRDILCDQCDYRTASEYKLRMHIEAIHEGIRYNCDVPGCGRFYRTKGSLYCHQDKAHNIPKPKTIEAMKKRYLESKSTQQNENSENS